MKGLWTCLILQTIHWLLVYFLECFSYILETFTNLELKMSQKRRVVTSPDLPFPSYGYRCVEHFLCMDVQSPDWFWQISLYVVGHSLPDGYIHPISPRQYCLEMSQTENRIEVIKEYKENSSTNLKTRHNIGTKKA